MPAPATPTGQKITRKQCARLLGISEKSVRRCTAIRLMPDGRVVFRAPIGNNAWELSVYSLTATE